MMDRAAVLATVERSYAARRLGDVEGTIADFAADATFRLAASDKITKLAFMATNHDEIRTTITALIDAFAFLHQDVLSVLIDGERASIHTRTTLRYNPTGTVVTTELVDLWTLKDGKVVAFIEFADTALVNHILAGGTAED